jgi:hypothetical protein
MIMKDKYVRVWKGVTKCTIPGLHEAEISEESVNVAHGPTEIQTGELPGTKCSLTGISACSVNTGSSHC